MPPVLRDFLCGAAICFTIITGAATGAGAAGSGENTPVQWNERIQRVIDITRPLQAGRNGRLPLYLWPLMDAGVQDEETASELLRLLDARGLGLVCTWNPANREQSLREGLAIARAQQRLGLRVNVNATPCTYGFFNGDPQTAHIDANGNPFFDDSLPGKIGCPFTLEPRKAAVRGQIEFFAEAYDREGIDVDFVFADWEIDGPLEVNRAHENSLRCERCRRNIPGIEDYTTFQGAIRRLRSELTRQCYAEPLTSHFPGALVGNYAVYPNDGYRYWYDYFETYEPGQPCKAEQAAKYRRWYQDFPLTGYTFAMPVVYTWYPTFNWYDFEPADYRWFYNMLKVASNAGANTPAGTPVISFVHWHTTSPPPNPDPAVRQMSPWAYQELLWHMLLRGTDTFFLWCNADEEEKEVPLLHEVYAAAQEYGEFLERGQPVTFDIPIRPGAVVSALALDDRLLVRRTDFAGEESPLILQWNGRRFRIPPAPGQCRIIESMEASKVEK